MAALCALSRPGPGPLCGNSAFWVLRKHAWLRRRHPFLRLSAKIPRIRANFADPEQRVPGIHSDKFKTHALSVERELDREQGEPEEPPLRLGVLRNDETMAENHASEDEFPTWNHSTQADPMPNGKVSLRSGSESKIRDAEENSSSSSNEEEPERGAWTWKDFRGKKHKAFYSRIPDDSQGSDGDSKSKRNRANSTFGHHAVADILHDVLQCKHNEEDVRKALNKWSEPSLHLLNLLRELKRLEECQLAKVVFEWSKSQYWYRPKVVTYGTMISIAAREGRVDLVERLFEDMQADGLTPCGFIYAGCVDALTRAGLYDGAVDVLHRRYQANDPHILSYFKILLDATMVDSPLPFVSSLLHKADKIGIKMDAEAFEIVLKGFSIRNLPLLVEETFDLMKRSGVIPSATCQSLLLSALAKLGKSQAMEEALDGMENGGLVSKRKIEAVKIEAAVRSGDFDRALKLFRVLDNRQKKISPYLFSLLLSACVKMQRVEEAFELLNEMKQVNSKRSLVIYNMVLSVCGRAKQLDRMDEVIDLLKADGLAPDSCTYTTMIQYCKGIPGGTERAIRLFEEMTAQDIPPDDVVYLMYFDLLSKEGCMEVAQEVFERLKEKDETKIQPRFYSILAFGWAKAGRFDESLKLLQEGKVVDGRTLWRLIELGIKEKKIHALKDLIDSVSKSDPTFLVRIRPSVEKWKVKYGDLVSSPPNAVQSDSQQMKNMLQTPDLPVNGTDLNRIKAKGNQPIGKELGVPQEIKKAMNESEEKENDGKIKVLKLQSRPSITSETLTRTPAQSLSNFERDESPSTENSNAQNLSLYSNASEISGEPIKGFANRKEKQLFYMGWRKLNPSNWEMESLTVPNDLNVPDNTSESESEDVVPHATHNDLDEFNRSEASESDASWIEEEKNNLVRRLDEMMAGTSESGIHSDSNLLFLADESGVDSQIVEGAEPEKDSELLGHCDSNEDPSNFERPSSSTSSESSFMEKVNFFTSEFIPPSYSSTSVSDSLSNSISSIPPSHTHSGPSFSSHPSSSFSSESAENRVTGEIKEIADEEKRIAKEVGKIGTEEKENVTVDGNNYVSENNENVLLGSETLNSDVQFPISEQEDVVLNLENKIMSNENEKRLEKQEIGKPDDESSYSASPFHTGENSSSSKYSVPDTSEFRNSPSKESLLNLLKNHCGEEKYFSSPASLLYSLSQLNLTHSSFMCCIEWMAQLCCNEFSDRDKTIFAASLLRLLHSDGHDPSTHSCQAVILSMMKNNLSDLARLYLHEMGRGGWTNARQAYHEYIKYNLQIDKLDLAKSALLMMREDGFQLGASEFCLLITWISLQQGQKEMKDLFLLLEEADVEGVHLDRDCMICVFDYLVKNQQYVKSVSWLRKCLGSHPETPPSEEILLHLLHGLYSSRMWRLSLDIFTMLHPFRIAHTLEGYTIVMKTLMRCNQPRLAVEISAQMGGLDIEPDQEIYYLLRNAYRKLGMESEWRAINEVLSS